jgi:hypothetical protein
MTWDDSRQLRRHELDRLEWLEKPWPEFKPLPIAELRRLAPSHHPDMSLYTDLERRELEQHWYRESLDWQQKEVVRIRSKYNVSCYSPQPLA